MAYMTVGKDPVRVIIDADPGATLTMPDNWVVGQPYELTVPTNKKVHVLSMSEAEILKRVGKLDEDSDVKFVVDGYRKKAIEIASLKRELAKVKREAESAFEFSKSFWRKKYDKAHGEVQLAGVEAAVDQEFPVPDDDDTACGDPDCCGGGY